MAVQSISGRNTGLIKALTDAGVIPDKTRRVIIDIDYESLVTIYYEVLADERLLNVDIAAHLKVTHKKEDAATNP